MAYQKGDFAAASEALANSFRIEPDVETLFAWAQSERQLEHCDKAIELFEKLLTFDLPAENKKVVRGKIDECKALLPPQQPEKQPEEAAEKHRETTGEAAGEAAEKQPESSPRSRDRAARQGRALTVDEPLRDRSDRPGGKIRSARRPRRGRHRRCRVGTYYLLSHGAHRRT